jgi:AcrR family transcriptional regulator
MTSNERRLREREEVRTKILDAARELFVEQGFDAVSMRKIAQKIDYSPTALYFHFRDKEALLEALCEHDFRAFAQEFAKFLGIKDPIERARKAAYAYIDFGLEHPNHYRFMFMTPKSRSIESTKIHRGNPEEDAYAFLQQLVQAAKDEGQFRAEYTDVEMITQVLWAGVHGLVSLHIAKGDEDWVRFKNAKQTGRVMLDMILNGLLRERGKR